MTVIAAVSGAIGVLVVILIVVFVARKHGACERGSAPKPGDLIPDVEFSGTPQRR